MRSAGLLTGFCSASRDVIPRLGLAPQLRMFSVMKDSWAPPRRAPTPGTIRVAKIVAQMDRDNARQNLSDVAKASPYHLPSSTGGGNVEAVTQQVGQVPGWESFARQRESETQRREEKATGQVQLDAYGTFVVVVLLMFILYMQFGDYRWGPTGFEKKRRREVYYDE